MPVKKTTPSKAKAPAKKKATPSKKPTATRKRKATPSRKKVTPSKPAHPLMIDEKTWNKEMVMDWLCDSFVCSSYGLGTILRAGFLNEKGSQFSLPSYSTIMKWLSEDDALSEKYARAREEQAEFMRDEMLDIADDGRNDWMEKRDKDGKIIGQTFNKESVQRSRLRIDSRKWLMAKLKPKKYGDRVDMNHGLQPDNPLVALAQQMQGGALKPTPNPSSSRKSGALTPKGK